MPKLDDYDDSHSAAPVSDKATASIGNKLSTGSSFAPTTPGYTPGTPAPAATPAFGSTSSFGGSTGGFGSPSTSSFGSPNTSSFGGSTPAFGANNAQQQTSAMQEGGTTAIEVSHGFSDFINQRWRPLMAVIYMITVTCDFVLFPIMWSLLQAMTHGNVTSQWSPLTLQGAGLYHIAMGAVLGLAAYGRSQEKIAGKA